jgi:hypothetical protein
MGTAKLPRNTAVRPEEIPWPIGKRVRARTLIGRADGHKRAPWTAEVLTEVKPAEWIVAVDLLDSGVVAATAPEAETCRHLQAPGARVPVPSAAAE